MQPRFVWSSHSLPVTDVHVGSGGARSRVASASRDGTCRVSDVQRSTQHHTDAKSGTQHPRLRISKSGLCLLQLWELSSGQLLRTFRFDSELTSVTLDQTETRLFAGASSGDIYQVNLYETVRTRQQAEGVPVCSSCLRRWSCRRTDNKSQP